jgi:hypothetical protein
MLVGDCAVFDTMVTENDLELKKEMEERKLHRMANVHDVLEMWQGSQNLRATQNESRTETSKGPPLDTFPILKRSSKHPDQTSNTMVQLHLNCQNDHLCHQFCLQRTSLQDKHK